MSPTSGSRFQLSAPAKSDLREISAFIAKDDRQAARRVRQEIRDALHRLAQNPGIGHLRQDLSPAPLRFHSVYSYMIAYMPDSRPIQVVRILHSSRDVRDLLHRPR